MSEEKDRKKTLWKNFFAGPHWLRPEDIRDLKPKRFQLRIFRFLLSGPSNGDSPATGREFSLGMALYIGIAVMGAVDLWYGIWIAGGTMLVIGLTGVAGSGFFLRIFRKRR